MKLAELVRTSSAVAAASGRLEKTSLLATFLGQLDDAEIEIALGFLIGWPRQGKLGIGWAAIESARPAQPATAATMELREVDLAFDELMSMRGKSSAVKRRMRLAELLARGTKEEQEFLGALAIGEVRQGALEGVLLEAVARAAGVPSDRLRRAVMLAGDLGTVARAVLGPDGADALGRYQLELFRPVQPMLADSAPTIAEALAGCDQPVVEWKLDGARIQVHARGDRVVVYTRNLNDVTAALPEVTEAVRALAVREVILDGEVIALAGDGRPLAFQETMRRFGRKLDADALRAQLPLTPFFFDVLSCDGEDLLERPLAERLRILDGVVPGALRVPRMIPGDVEGNQGNQGVRVLETSRTTDSGARFKNSDPLIRAAERFQEDALARGHEGVMVKALASTYAAGRRGSAWLKVKTARTMDLVVLAVEWGSGRRKGWLSNLHLGARDPGSGAFVMLGKTFKGLTDETLEWQTRELLARETRREGHVVHVRPELVVEIAFNEVQRSSQYPGGVTLRFARVKGYRPDKLSAEADTIDAVRALAPPA
jgi:DNA ligase-1